MYVYILYTYAGMFERYILSREFGITFNTGQLLIGPLHSDATFNLKNAVHIHIICDG